METTYSIEEAINMMAEANVYLAEAARLHWDFTSDSGAVAFGQLGQALAHQRAFSAAGDVKDSFMAAMRAMDAARTALFNARVCVAEEMIAYLSGAGIVPADDGTGATSRLASGQRFLAVALKPDAMVNSLPKVQKALEALVAARAEAAGAHSAGKLHPTRRTFKTPRHV